jgi:AraC-like DNA-binding protein
MHIERRVPPEPLRPFLLGAIEGWEQADAPLEQLREVPFPGVPLILGLDTAWELDGPQSAERESSFVAGLHAAPTLVRPTAPSWSCVELRLTPIAAHRIFGLPMHELANRTVALVDVAPESDELVERLREAPWPERFDLVERFLLRRFDIAHEPARGVEWSWQELRRTNGRTAIGELADELGWSHRRLIARFREQVGLAPKAVARVIRFDRAAQTLRSAARGLAEVAYECGYYDQAHMNRDFRELGGTSPDAFRASLLESGGVSA